MRTLCLFRQSFPGLTPAIWSNHPSHTGGTLQDLKPIAAHRCERKSRAQGRATRAADGRCRNARFAFFLSLAIGCSSVAIDHLAGVMEPAMSLSNTNIYGKKEEDSGVGVVKPSRQILHTRHDRHHYQIDIHQQEQVKIQEECLHHQQQTTAGGNDGQRPAKPFPRAGHKTIEDYPHGHKGG